MPGSGKLPERDFSRTAPDKRAKAADFPRDRRGLTRDPGIWGGGIRAAGARPGELEELDLAGSCSLIPGKREFQWFLFRRSHGVGYPKDVLERLLHLEPPRWGWNLSEHLGSGDGCSSGALRIVLGLD